ncbi:MAG: NAD(P)/FAD-dependent oxidoreductase [Ignavibacteria bacterium]
MHNITIVGAGLAGSLLSVYLAKKGFEVNVYERRPDMRKESADGGKSINLALSARGIHALKEVGMFEEIKKISIPMYGRMIHTADGELNFQRYGKDDSEFINAVSRAELNKSLMDLADNNDKVKFNFNEKCTGVNFKEAEVSFHNEKTNALSKVRSDVVIATDGASSAVRMEMLKVPRFNFSQEYENYGYKELRIPPGNNGDFLMEKNALHIWPRGKFMLIALPNPDGSFTCTLFMAYDEFSGGENSFEFLNSDDRVKNFFNTQFRDAFQLMPDLLVDYFHNPTGNLITIKCFPWVIEDKVALLGDSAHAIVPFFGQGMNAAFEDCTCLNECIDKHGNDWGKILKEYQFLRKENSDAIADLAQENFIEMRDLVADKRFQLKKKIEAELYKKHPDKFIPKYSMVTFHRIPYSIALERGRIQERILNKLSEGVNSLDDVNFDDSNKMVSGLKEFIGSEM